MDNECYPREKTTWAMPSVGCVIKFDHLNKHFLILMKENPTDAETESVERVVTNLPIPLDFRKLAHSS